MASRVAQSCRVVKSIRRLAERLISGNLGQIMLFLILCDFDQHRLKISSSRRDLGEYWSSVSVGIHHPP